jgi:enoyl-CoA hydratase/carnithine racemase
MTEAAGLVEVSVDDGVAWVVLNDPGRRNCVSEALSLELAARCAALGEDPDVRAVVLTGAGSVFSAGGDLEALSSGRISTETYRAFDALAELSIPTLAAVNGPAVGAGLSFALACDVVVAAESARFDARFLDLGIHPAGGFLWRLQRRVGAQAAAALVLFGDALSSAEAAAVGLVWRCVPDDQLEPVARRLASRAAGRSAELVRRTKATLRAEVSITDQRLAGDIELVAQRWSTSRPAFAEGVRLARERLARPRTSGTGRVQ